MLEKEILGFGGEDFLGNFKIINDSLYWRRILFGFIIV